MNVVRDVLAVIGAYALLVIGVLFLMAARERSVHRDRKKGGDL